MNEQAITDNETIKQAFLAQLRASTGEMHKRLEETKLSAQLMSEDVSLADYTLYLQYMRNVIAHCETVVYDIVKPLMSDINERRKLPLIEQDIIAVGGQNADSHIPVYNILLRGHDIAFALGYMYVIEGSTLGGRILLNHVGKKLNINEHKGATFFAGYGADTGRMWKQFLNLFSTYAADELRSGAAIAGSRFAFESIEQYFSRN